MWFILVHQVSDSILSDTRGASDVPHRHTRGPRPRVSDSFSDARRGRDGLGDCACHGAPLSHKTGDNHRPSQ